MCPVIQGNLQCFPFLRSLLGIGISDDTFSFTVIHTLKTLTGTDRPVYGTGCNSKLLLDLIEKFKRIIGIPVHFINKGKNRNLTHHTDLKQLSGLRLNTL